MIEDEMFGGVGTLVVASAIRILQIRQWREGVGLSPKRRFLLPAIAVALGLLGLRRVHGGDAADHAALLVAAFVLTLVGGAARALSARRFRTTADALHPGGLVFRVPAAMTLADAVVPVVAATLVLPALVPGSGLHAGAAVWTLALGAGDLLASALLMTRPRAASGVA